MPEANKFLEQLDYVSPRVDELRKEHDSFEAPEPDKIQERIIQTIGF